MSIVPTGSFVRAVEKRFIQNTTSQGEPGAAVRSVSSLRSRAGKLIPKPLYALWSCPTGTVGSFALKPRACGTYTHTHKQFLCIIPRLLNPDWDSQEPRGRTCCPPLQAAGGVIENISWKRISELEFCFYHSSNSSCCAVDQATFGLCELVEVCGKRTSWCAWNISN